MAYSGSAEFDGLSINQAAQRGDLEAVTKIIAEESNTYAQTILMVEAFIEAGNKEHLDIFYYILGTENFYSIVGYPYTDPDDPKESQSTLDFTNKKGPVLANLLLSDNPLSQTLLSAAQHGCVNVIRILTDTNQKSAYPHIDNTLIQATRFGHANIVGFLIRNYRTQITDHAFNNALKIAAQNGYCSVIDLILAETNTKFAGFSDALIQATKAGHFLIIKHLFGDYTDDEEKNFITYARDADRAIPFNQKYIDAAFISAAKHGHFDIAHFLLTKNANVNFSKLQRAISLLPASPALTAFLKRTEFIYQLENYLRALPPPSALKPKSNSLHFRDHPQVPSVDTMAKYSGARCLLKALRNASSHEIRTTLFELMDNKEQFSLMCSALFLSRFQGIFNNMMDYYATMAPVVATSISTEAPARLLASAAPRSSLPTALPTIEETTDADYDSSDGSCQTIDVIKRVHFADEVERCPSSVTPFQTSLSSTDPSDKKPVSAAATPA